MERTGHQRSRPTLDVSTSRRPQRLVFDAENDTRLPGRLLRAEGDPATGDRIADGIYDAIGATLHLMNDVFGRPSIDNRSGNILASVHYGKLYPNAVWNGVQLVIGDGDGEIFADFSSIDMIATELTKSLIESEVGLYYWGESGALAEAIAAVFGCLAKQYALGQTADRADWLIGQGVFGPRVSGVALKSLKAPGTAYDDVVLGRDSEVARMQDYVETVNDQGGIHINSGIPAHAFYLLAGRLGGYAWDKAGQIWYRALISGSLGPSSDFQAFAQATCIVSEELYGSGTEAEATANSWKEVGLLPSALGR